MTELLSLNGKDLERELDRIIKTDSKRERKWTPKEEEILRRLKGKVSYSRIAELLGRTHASVKSKGNGLEGAKRKLTNLALAVK